MSSRASSLAASLGRLARAVALALALPAAAVSGASCAGPKATGPVGLSPHADKSAWRDVIAEHTRRDESYDWAVRMADARATLITPALRKAFLDSRFEFQGRFAEKTERELVALGEPDPGVDVESRPRPESEEQVLFFVAMYVTDQKNRDIGASYTIWNTELRRGGSSTRPIAIEPVQRSPAVLDIFPFADRFDDLYLVRFPLADSAGKAFLTPGGEPLTLHIESALATLDLQWTLVE
jgi:hypothetical protein